MWRLQRLRRWSIATVGVPALIAIAAGPADPERAEFNGRDGRTTKVRRIILAQAKSKPTPKKGVEPSKASADKNDTSSEPVGLARWKKASPKTTPVVTPSTNFLLFSSLPKDRASAASRAVQGGYGQLRSLFGHTGVDWGGKASLFVFNDALTYGEFVRTTDGRTAAEGETGMARFDVPQPYVAVIDPLGGREARPTAAHPVRKAGRGKRGKGASAVSTPATVEPTLHARLFEQLVAGAGSKAGKPPRWLTLGIGDRLAMGSERRSPYYRKLLHDATLLAEQSWITKATEALGGSARIDDERAVGFAVVQWLAAHDVLPAMTKALLVGGDKLDDAVNDVLNLTREEFLRRTADALTGAADLPAEGGEMEGLPDFFNQ